VHSASTAADRLLEGDRVVAAELAVGLLKPHRDNLVERPWGGRTLCELKRLTSPACDSNRTFGESFEISADDADDEARMHPSVLTLVDGSTITLPALLAVHADTLLGEAFVQRHGRRFPLLPKLLDVAELLSVQAHPPGNVEVYVIVEAEPGATIRVGFAADVDVDHFRAALAAGRRDQQGLLELLRKDAAADLQALLKPWLACRSAMPAELEAVLRPRLNQDERWTDAAALLGKLRSVYWHTLDALNAICVEAGDVIYNANPPRVAAARGEPVSAEVHALGNPEGRSVFALEIRRPGPTFRAWDNVRFPLRDIDVDAALEALNLRATSPAEFVVKPKLVRPGVRRSVDCEHFRLEHLEPTLGVSVDVPASTPHSLHALAGHVRLQRGDGRELGTLERGESALVPVNVGAYRIVAVGAPSALVKVDLPPDGD
jgi:mannose-6-phosphate isomerase class I